MYVPTPEGNDVVDEASVAPLKSMYEAANLHDVLGRETLENNPIRKLGRRLRFSAKPRRHLQTE